MKLETVMLHGYAVEIRQVLDQRITRLRCEHTISRIAQQLEQQRISLTCACRQYDSVRRHSKAASREIIRDRLARRKQAEGLWLVTECALLRHRCKQARRIRKTGTCGIGQREVDHLETRRATPIEGKRQPVAAARVPQARRKHQRSWRAALDARNCSRLALVASAYSSICFVRSCGYVILTSRIAPSASRTGSSFGCTKPV